MKKSIYLLILVICVYSCNKFSEVAVEKDIREIISYQSEDKIEVISFEKVTGTEKKGIYISEFKGCVRFKEDGFSMVYEPFSSVIGKRGFLALLKNKEETYLIDKYWKPIKKGETNDFSGVIEYTKKDGEWKKSGIKIELTLSQK